MRAHIESGDRSAAEHVSHEHTAALEQADRGDPDDQVEQLHLSMLPGSRSIVVPGPVSEDPQAS